MLYDSNIDISPNKRFMRRSFFALFIVSMARAGKRGGCFQGVALLKLRTQIFPRLGQPSISIGVHTDPNNILPHACNNSRLRSMYAARL